MSLFEDVTEKSGYEFDLCFAERDKTVIGIDEVGRGPLAGPVVCAAVALNYDKLLSGLNDSKKLSEKQREELFPQIIANAKKIGVGMSYMAEIDRINILEATIVAMKRAVDNSILLIDGLSFPYKNFKAVKIIKGDAKSPAIMAASIVAKVIRDRLMDFYDPHFPHYGFKDHKGYGTNKHRLALMQYGYSPLHRKSFDPVKQGKIQPLEGSYSHLVPK